MQTSAGKEYLNKVMKNITSNRHADFSAKQK